MRKLFTILQAGFVAGLVLLVGSCGSDNSLAPLSANDVVVAFGDSLTDGVGASKGKSYPEILASLTGLNVVNEGVSGETTIEGLQRLPSVLQKHQPKLVILMEGGNDILRNMSKAQAKKNLAQMIQKIRQSGAQVVMLGIPEKKLFSDSADFYDELASEFQLVYDGEIMSDLLKKRSYKSDSIHLNNAGYRQLANHIKSILEEQGAL
ncbi:GDSL-type esterase/lipase family protein [Kangiella shandongensis]|uniref:GDSL-type esterase/lipase family protein n=1 Tax=Kangiella shandongensis TaxID=2763258 RepID=UPI001CBCAC6E|nr:GDSL-type esterase/lipase family protein [Kangiella shandongensis]